MTLGRGSFPSPGLRAGGGTLPVQWGMAEWGTRAEWQVPPRWRMVLYSHHDGGAPLAPVAGAPVLSCQLPSSLPIPSIIVSGGLVCLIFLGTQPINFSWVKHRYKNLNYGWFSRGSYFHFLYFVVRYICSCHMKGDLQFLSDPGPIIVYPCQSLTD